MKTPTLIGEIVFAMHAFQKLGAPRPEHIEMTQKLLDKIAAELLVEPSELMRISFDGAKIKVENIPVGEVYLW